MEDEKLQGAVEAILFAMGGAVELKKIAAAIGKTPEETKKILEQYQTRCSREDRGICLIELEDSYQLCTKKEFYSCLTAILSQPKKAALTDVMMETLAIIAYRQPVTKAEIEKIRGVKSDHAVNKLIEYGLVQELGRLDAPGRPLLFGTTEEFLRDFGIDSRENLPEISPALLEDFKEEAEAEAGVKVEV